MQAMSRRMGSHWHPPRDWASTASDRRHVVIEGGTGLSSRTPLRTGRADLLHQAVQSVVGSMMVALGRVVGDGSSQFGRFPYPFPKNNNN